MKPIYLLMILLMFESCKSVHNIPNNQTPNELIGESSYKIYVDQNGDFYTDNWESEYGSHPKNASGPKDGYSLSYLAKDKGKIIDLKEFRSELLKDIKGVFMNKKRIFIFIHGYNNNYSKAKEGFKNIKEKINFADEDGIIEFYWDGLYAKGPVSSFDIWFNATGYSQLAGERSLRPILNLFENQEVILISHSRGASVVLSSLSDPPYNKKFAEDTFKHHGIKVYNQPKLAKNNNIIKVLMLAHQL